MTRQIAVIGECMVELRRAAQGLLAQGFGGDTLNTALYLARLGQPSEDHPLGSQALQVRYVTALGQDGLSSQMLAAWQAAGVNIDWVQRLADKAPGLYLIDTAANGERSFTYWRNDAAARYWLEREPADAILAALGQCELIYLSGISLAILPAASRQRLMTALAKARAQGARLVFDNNYRPRLWADQDTARAAYAAMLAQTDIALLTQDDEVALWEDPSLEQTIVRTQDLGVAEIVIKRGAEPCLIVTAQQRSEVAATRLDPALVVDTTAAGDSFSAGYLAARLQGSDTTEAAHAGHRLAAAVIQYPGAIIPPSHMPQSPCH